MLSNIDLFELADHYRVPLATVCLRTSLPRKGPSPGLTIVNLDDGSQGGTHWTAYFFDGSRGVYFDSFGACPPPEVMRWARKSPREPVPYNAWICQDIKTSTCGWFCLAFGAFLSQERGPAEPLVDAANRFVNLFEDNTKKNNTHLFRYLDDIAPRPRLKA